jgi:lipoic acid synthetase
MNQAVYVRKPEWLKVQLHSSNNWKAVKATIQGERLHTVCEEARCPNIHECWGTHQTATFMILGDTCTRRCRFCAVKTGLPTTVDREEPGRVADSVAHMGLAHVVVTMVTRDDLPDGGAAILAETVRAIRAKNPGTTIEILSSDLMGNRDSIAVLVAAQPDILSHNLETVRRLTMMIRSRSTYDRSLGFLRRCAELDPKIAIKSSIMLGLGETAVEVEQTMLDLRSAGASMMNLGQYLQPSRLHAPVERFWTPDEFAQFGELARSKGFAWVESGPLVRSSYHAKDQYRAYQTVSSELQRSLLLSNDLRDSPLIVGTDKLVPAENDEAKAMRERVAEYQKLAKPGVAID